MRFRRLITYLITVVFLVMPFIVLSKRQAISDWWILRNYQPPVEIVSLAQDTTMTDKSIHLFYVSKPELKDLEEFRLQCSSSEQTIVLGCYKNGMNIYVYNVKDDRLTGVQQVTAAHEMLHAAYERLSKNERFRVDEMTAKAYASLTDERVRKNVEAYRNRDPSVVPNELHSILATEVKNLPTDLELYYSQYFKNRSVVVGFSEEYEAEFSKREKQVEQYDTQLTNIKVEYDALLSEIKEQEKQLSAYDASLDELEKKQDIKGYNKLVPIRNAVSTSINSNITKLKAMYNQYQTILESRNKIAVEEQQLLQAIDTRVSNKR